eukprot:365636-Chlamydomonas_euryale.AAC.15
MFTRAEPRRPRLSSYVSQANPGDGASRRPAQDVSGCVWDAQDVAQDKSHRVDMGSGQDTPGRRPGQNGSLQSGGALHALSPLVVPAVRNPTQLGPTTSNPIESRQQQRKDRHPLLRLHGGRLHRVGP